MSEISIDLNSYNDRFVEKSNLVLDKKLNFVFGKNGTGKTTIVKAIKERYSDIHDIYIFDGYKGIIGENEGLDAIVLGVENTEIQQQINKKEKEISQLQKELNEDSLEENLAKKNKTANVEFEQQNTKIDKFFSEAASKINNQTDTPIKLTKSYDKNTFSCEIQYAKLISDEEYLKFKKIIKEDKKDNVTNIMFPVFNGENILKQVNSILNQSISIKTKILELDSNTDKQNFAREGLKVHKHENGETCAFCGNVVSDERWVLLGQYFDTEVSDLENNIEVLLSVIEQEKRKIKEIVLIDTEQFYEQFKKSIQNCNNKIQLIKDNYGLFLNELDTTLNNKKKKLFTKSNILMIDVPNNLSTVNKEYEIIVRENNNFSKDIENEKKLAKSNLRYHEVKKALEEFNYEAENQKLKDLDKIKKKIEEEVNTKKSELIKKESEKSNLIEKTKDEQKLAKKIDQCLKNTGLDSFTLELVTGINEKGQYLIKGHNGKIRPIKELSDGEKNIVAFLYFIFKLESPEFHNKRNKIIIFDDPMNSNDDTMQYLMITEIKKLYNRLLDNDYLLLLTHNIHFYLNVRPSYIKDKDDKEKEPNKKYHKKNNYFKLYSNGQLTKIIPIESSDNDFKSNYHTLWEDLIYLYNNDKPISMINNCRRILETYINFNCCNKETFYENNEEAKKLFNVNSHGIEDLENEPNGKTKDQIKFLLKGVLEKNNAGNHFEKYFSE